jgi:hypothetical protein
LTVAEAISFHVERRSARRRDRHRLVLGRIVVAAAEQAGSGDDCADGDDARRHRPCEEADTC